MGEATYKKLIVWQKSDELAHQIYLATKNFPKNELKQFLNIALGSLAETEYFLDFSLKLGYLNEENHKHLQNLRQEVGNLLWSFYKSI